MLPLKKAILRTLAYADIFDYPLKKEEIWKFLILNQESGITNVEKTLSELRQISQKEKFYFFKGRAKVVAFRKKRARWSKKKVRTARRAASWLKLVPTIKMVAITGALAMENSQKDDDLDLLIVTAKNRLWLTRLMTVLLIELVASRRRPQDKKVEDKICLNMFLDEAHLALPKKEQDLFSAHEVYQMKVLWEKDGIYKRFLKANLWARKYLPNWRP